MHYDKNSFIAGLAVGRQLKGWATTAYRNRDPGIAPTVAMTVLTRPDAILSAGLSVPHAGFGAQGIGVAAVLIPPAQEYDLGTLAPPHTGFGAARIGMQIVRESRPTIAVGCGLYAPSLGGTLTAHGEMEGNET